MTDGHKLHPTPTYYLVRINPSEQCNTEEVPCPSLQIDHLLCVSFPGFLRIQLMSRAEDLGAAGRTGSRTLSDLGTVAASRPSPRRLSLQAAPGTRQEWLHGKEALGEEWETIFMGFLRSVQSKRGNQDLGGALACHD